MKRDFTDLKVGDYLWVVGHQYTGRKETRPAPMQSVRVVKVGRKYVVTKPTGADGLYNSVSDYDEVQFTRADGCTPTYNDGRMLFHDLQDYADHREHLSVRSAFLRHFYGYGARLDENVTTEEIRAAAKLLRIELKEKEA